ncbi:MAG: hypothetical protein K0R69_3226 [Clostridia bacterium]|jgi:hypothetical protein|nr:hypothetical protein [Clostridia bacterium]
MKKDFPLVSHDVTSTLKMRNVMAFCKVRICINTNQGGTVGV